MFSSHLRGHQVHILYIHIHPGNYVYTENENKDHFNYICFLYLSCQLLEDMTTLSMDTLSCISVNRTHFYILIFLPKGFREISNSSYRCDTAHLVFRKKMK